MITKANILIYFVLLFFGCSNLPTTKVIDNVKVVNLSKCFDDTLQINLSVLGDSIEYILLETRDDCLIGEVEKCKITEFGVFVLSSSLTEKALFYFSKEGNFKRKIGLNGRGPGEYNNIIDFDVFLNKVIITSDNNGILVYDTTGSFLSRIDVKSMVSAIQVNKSNLYAFHTFPYSYYNKNYLLDTYDSKSLILRDQCLYREFSNSLINKINKAPFFPFYSIFPLQDTVIYWDFSCDTVYSLSNGNLIPRYFISIDETVFSRNLEDFFDLNTYMTSNRGLLTKYIESNDYIIFPNTIISNKVYHLFYSKKDGSYFNVVPMLSKINYHQNTCFRNDIDGGWPFFPHGITFCNNLYGFFYPTHFQDLQKMGLILSTDKWSKTQIKEKLNNERSLSNPIIMIIH